MSLELIDTAAHALGPLVEEVVFVGGASIQLWISDPAAPATRATDDVDVISAITTRIEYYGLAERLRERGFSEASDSHVICRWNHQETGLVIDVMPQEEDVLGFSNPWYQHAIETAIARELPSGARIHAASPPAIVATKLAAWTGRGKGDLLRSLDLHDVLVLIDGRPELASELAHEPSALRAYVAAESSLLHVFAPRAAAVLAFLLVFGLVGGSFLPGQILGPHHRHHRRQRAGTPNRNLSGPDRPKAH